MGAGTFVSAERLADAVACGAAFIVAPTLDVGIVERSVGMGVPVIPGAYSPTEIALAWESGATFVKVFPASSLGPRHVREVRAPLPDIEMIATGGVDAASARSFLDAGCVAVGVGGALVRCHDGRAAGDRPGGRVTRLAGKAILVTGSTGIAAATANRAATEGARVFVVSRTADHARDLANGLDGAGWAAADLTDEDAVNSAVTTAVDHFGSDRRAVLAVGGSGRRFGDGPLHDRDRGCLGGDCRAQPSYAGPRVPRGSCARCASNLSTLPATRGSMLLLGSVTTSAPVPELFGTHAYAAAKGALTALMTSMAATYIGGPDPGEPRRPVVDRHADGDPRRGDADILEYAARKQPLAGVRCSTRTRWPRRQSSSCPTSRAPSRGSRLRSMAAGRSCRPLPLAMTGDRARAVRLATHIAPMWRRVARRVDVRPTPDVSVTAERCAEGAAPSPGSVREPIGRAGRRGRHG